MQVLLASFQLAALPCWLELRLNSKRMGLAMFSYQHFLDLSYYWLQNWLIPIVAEGRGKGGIAVPCNKAKV